MPAPLSIVIPTLNAAGALPSTLACLVEGVAAGLVRELIVSDGGSDDATCIIADEAGAIVVVGTAGRGLQIRRAAHLARGEWLLVLHADTLLPSGWAEVVQPAMMDPARAHAFRLSFRSRGIAPRVVAGWANLRSRLFGLPYGDQGLLLSRCLLDEIGGYPDLPLMEDVATARALKGRVGLLGATVSTGAERYEAEGWARRGGRNLRTLARYLAGTDPEILARDYGGPARADTVALDPQEH
jgi:rSAM/selenodomain-associated transferase 2